jgi:hypothetical protein
MSVISIKLVVFLVEATMQVKVDPATIAKASRSPLTVIDCAAQRPRHSPGAPVVIDTVSSIPCYAHGGFCKCWMPAWFHFAEMAARERLVRERVAENAQAMASNSQTRPRPDEYVPPVAPLFDPRWPPPGADGVAHREFHSYQTS